MDMNVWNNYAYSYEQYICIRNGWVALNVQLAIM